MKMILASVLAASTLSIAAPAVAQSVYIGPNGVGVGVGAHPYRGYRDREEFRGRGPAFEGRSIYRPGRREFRRDRDRD